jgi:23S rRNA pseudouridine955/2504/2580 synthase
MAKPSTRTEVRVIKIDAGHDGQRIDNFLIGLLKGVPRSHIYRLLRTGQVRVNKGRIKPTYRLHEGDQVRLPPTERAETVPVKISDDLAQALSQSIRYEDDDFMIIDKPSGLPVHGGTGLRIGVIEALRELRPGCPDLDLAHRLDRFTSGCLLVVKARSLLPAVARLFRDGQVEKRYRLLVKGRWTRTSVVAPLRRGQMRSGERMVVIDRAGKESRTDFRLLAAYHGASLLEATLKTGRTHQIRVHTAATGHPIAGDEKYGEQEFNHSMRELGLRRIFLHAHAIAFRHPREGRMIRVVCPLPPALEAVLARLEVERRPRA